MLSPIYSSSSIRTDFAEAFPNSRKVYVSGERVEVPMREISLSDGEPSLRVYDTSGPHDSDIRTGLAPLRETWVVDRGDTTKVPCSDRVHGSVEMPSSLRRSVFRGVGPVTQMHYARRGEVTAEMEFVALREGFDPDFVRAEVARGRAIIPANINHPELEPTVIGRNFLVKINANIGN